MLIFCKRSRSLCGIWDSNSFDEEEPELELESHFEESAQAYIRPRIKIISFCVFSVIKQYRLFIGKCCETCLKIE